ncbi:MAG: heparinase II/III family protein [Alphaproteobacteria bacterium]|nr:heparinase II/III family protein [Alphaproteobacteria bacterium]
MQRMLRRSVLSPVRKGLITTTIPEHWQPPDPWKGNAGKGQKLASGSHPVELHAKGWHRFTWLRDMREYGGNQSRTLARRFVLEWIDQNQRWSAETWHPQLLAERLRTLVLTWGWFGASATTSQQQMIVNAIQAQAIILKKDWRGLANGNARIEALTALILVQAFLEENSDPTSLADALITENFSLILSDGCHASRQPDLHVTLLSNLIEARIGLNAINARSSAPPKAAAGKTSPENTPAENTLAGKPNAEKTGYRPNTSFPQLAELLAGLEDNITRMGAVGRMWRHASGTMMGILGSHEINPDQLDDVLDRAGPKGRVSNHASDSGFIRMTSGRSVMLMNTGPAPWALPNIMAAGGRPDAGALSLEFSNGSNSIIVNAGQQKALFDDLPDLATALAGTAAFSTLSVDRTNSSDLLATSAAGRHATIDHAETGPATGGWLAEAKHDGYEKTHGLIHQRRVYLCTGGNDLRGEDIILYTGAPGHIPNEATIRFHLHPRINATMAMGGHVLLRLPGTAAPWIFKAQGGEMQVEDSVIMGRNGMEKCAQITIIMPLGSIRSDYSKSVKWALRRQAKPRATAASSPS